MNRFKSITNPMMWLMALLMAVFVAGCGGGGGSPANTTTPTVSSTFPVDADIGIALNTSVTAIFSEAMRPSTITAATFLLTDGVTPVPGTVTYVGTTATFKPTSSLAPSTLYTVVVNTGAKDKAGKAMAFPKTWSFTTGAAPDTTAPTVSSTIPVDTDTGIALNSNITATFNEPMDAATISATTFTLKHGTTSVSGTVSNVGTTAAFNPASNLAASTVYTATITTGAKDLAGNALASDHVWTFTTGTTASTSPAPVLLGKAGDYVIFANTGIDSATGGAVITGNIGVGPGVTSTAITGFALSLPAASTYSTSAQVTGKIYAFDYAPPTPTNVNTASLDMGTAYTDAAGRIATSAATTDVGGGTLTSLTLAPGVYEWGSFVTIPTDLTLSGSATDVWIFKVAGTLDMAAAKNVILIGGAQAKNVFWQISGAVTIGANTHFEGIMLGQTSITFGHLASIKGRLLAQSAVNLDANTVTVP